jgi:hypothetical protein
MYAITMNELKAVPKLSAQEGQSGTLNKTSVDSAAQDDDFHEVKRCKRHTSNNTAKKLTKPVPTSAAVKMLPKSVLTRNFFTPLRTTDMDTETTEAENALQEQKAPRKSGRPPPIMMNSITNLIPLQSDLKRPYQTEYKFQNTRNGTHIRTKEMADSSAMIFYLEKNILKYFIFFPNSGKPVEVVIRHFPPVMPAEDISNSLEDLSFNIISVRQMTAA